MASEENRKLEYGCVMANLKIPYWNSFVNRIEERDLYHKREDDSFGREKDPHVTILFGLHEHIPDSYIAKVCTRIKPIPIQLRSISTFSDNEDFDVLKFDVKSSYLRFLNEAFKKFPYTSSYPSYNPHLTIAYLKKEKAEKYFWLFNEIPTQEFLSEEIVYSKTSGEKLRFDL